MAYGKNVFILGAGASAGAGAPVLNNFLKKARELLENVNSGLTSEQRKAFREVFEWRSQKTQALRYMNIDLDNIEELFSLVDMAQQLGDEVAGEMVDNLINLVSCTLELSVEFDFDPALGMEHGRDIGSTSNDLTYRSFVEVLEKWSGSRDLIATEKDSFITLNYDTIFDRILLSMGRGFTYSHPEWHSPEMDADSHKLLKLHGSTNWGRCRECGYKKIETRFFYHGGRVTGVEKITMDPARTLYQTECSQCQESALRPFIVPPTWNKASYSEDLVPIWRTAREELAKAARLFIVGYSLPRTDSFFKYLLALGLSENDSLQEIILIDPAEGDVGESLKGRYLEFIAPFFDTNSFTFWDVPFHVGAKALEYRFIDGDSGDDALEKAVDSCTRNGNYSYYKRYAKHGRWDFRPLC